MRSLLGKDLKVLRRSPAIVAVLIIYPAVIALLLGLALSRAPDKPRVAIYNGLKNGGETLTVGGTKVDPREYAEELFKSIEPLDVDSREEAVSKVKDGEALAAIIVPEDLLTSLQGLVGLNASSTPRIEILYNGSDPLKRDLAESAIKARVSDLNRAVAGKLTSVAAGYIDLLLRGGSFKLLGQSFDVVGLERSKRAIDRVSATLPEGSSRRNQLEAVSRFAGLAIANLGLSTKVLDKVGSPVEVKTTEVSGSKGASLDAYSIAIAVTLSLMLIAVLLSAGLLAMEREENTLERLLRGPVSVATLVASKVLLAALLAATAGFVLTAGVSIFFGIDWSRALLWLVALPAAGLACAGFGTGLGGLTRDVRAASLIGILVALPLTFLALVPEGAVNSWLFEGIQAVSAVLPFKPALSAVDAAINGPASVWGPAMQLLAVALGWSAIGAAALRRSS